MACKHFDGLCRWIWSSNLVGLQCRTNWVLLHLTALYHVLFLSSANLKPSFRSGRTCWKKRHHWIDFDADNQTNIHIIGVIFFSRNRIRHSTWRSSRWLPDSTVVVMTVLAELLLTQWWMYWRIWTCFALIFTVKNVNVRLIVRPARFFVTHQWQNYVRCNSLYCTMCSCVFSCEQWIVFICRWLSRKRVTRWNTRLTQKSVRTKLICKSSMTTQDQWMMNILYSNTWV